MLHLNEQKHLHIPERSKNHIEFKNQKVIKTSTDNLSGEIYWYQNIPRSLKSLFPQLLKINNQSSYEISLINGQTLTHLYLEQKLTTTHLDNLIETINKIHNCIPEHEDFCNPPKNLDIYYNYIQKTTLRYNDFDYNSSNLNLPKNHKHIFNLLIDYFTLYKKLNRGTTSVIHGDPVFTNIIFLNDLNHNQSFKFVDMRGKCGDLYTIWGDKWYDYGKIYQSLIGYDEILIDKTISKSYKNNLIKHFENYIIDNFGVNRLTHLRWITANLIFSMIPLHNNSKCTKYYDLIEPLIFLP